MTRSVARQLSAIVLMMHGFAFALVIDTQGEYHFGPDTSRNQACYLAGERAKYNALSWVVGEQLSSEEKLTCQQSTGQDTTTSCEMNRITWSFLDSSLKFLRFYVDKKLISGPAITGSLISVLR